MGKHIQSVDSRVIGRIRDKGKGWVFTPADFLDHGSRTAVGLALMRHVRAGTIRKLFAKSIGENSAHGSDSDENAALEIAQFFSAADIVG